LHIACLARDETCIAVTCSTSRQNFCQTDIQTCREDNGEDDTKDDGCSHQDNTEGIHQDIIEHLEQETLINDTKQSDHFLSQEVVVFEFLCLQFVGSLLRPLSMQQAHTEAVVIVEGLSKEHSTCLELCNAPMHWCRL